MGLALCGSAVPDRTTRAIDWRPLESSPKGNQHAHHPRPAICRPQPDPVAWVHDRCRPDARARHRREHRRLQRRQRGGVASHWTIPSRSSWCESPASCVALERPTPASRRRSSLDYQSRTDLFAAVAGVLPISANVTGGDTPTRVEMMLVSWNYFSILGVAPAYGRAVRPGGRCAWRRQRRGRERRILAAASRTPIRRPSAGRSSSIRTPSWSWASCLAGFHHPGRTLQNDVEVWSPSGFRGSATAPLSRSRRRIDGCLARLQPGVTLDQAQARLAEYGAAVSLQFPSDYPAQNGWRPRVTSLQDDVVGGVSTTDVHAAGGRRPALADRVRQRRTSGPRAVGGTTAGDGDSEGARCARGPIDPATRDRKRAARGCRWRARPARRIVGVERLRGACARPQCRGSTA